MTIWVFPIEPFDDRYTAQWYKWFSERFATHTSAEVCIVDGSRAYDKVENGQWLDTIFTHIYKSSQLLRFARHVYSGDVKAGDTVLLLDGWNPAVVNLAYMRDAGGVDFTIVGCLHAGTWDPHDFLSQQPRIQWWGPRFEAGMLACYDELCVATKFHESLLDKAFGAMTLPRVNVTGFPLYIGEFADHWRAWEERENLVVFPHRLAPEKQPAVFAKLEAMFQQRHPELGAQFVRSRDVCSTKAAYYELLGRARVVVSTALQETWGIAMLEGALLGAHPVCPNRLSYPEVHGADCCYDDLDDAVAHIARGLTSPNEHMHHNRGRWTTALRRIAEVC